MTPSVDASAGNLGWPVRQNNPVETESKLQIQKFQMGYYQRLVCFPTMHFSVYPGDGEPFVIVQDLEVSEQNIYGFLFYTEIL